MNVRFRGQRMERSMVAARREYDAKLQHMKVKFAQEVYIARKTRAQPRK